MTVTGYLGASVGVVYVVVQLPVIPSNVHTVELNEPPALPSSNVTVPTGVVGELNLSVTVALNTI